MKQIKSLPKRFLLAIFVAILMVFSFTGCKPYEKPEIKTIEPSQTAFMIPLVGDSNQQAAFASEEMLAKAKVASKEVTIPHRWVQTGRMWFSGEWRPSARLIVVERKPETREWTSTADTGTTAKNQAIFAESKESIGFSVGMNCSAQIDEADATKFLYRYNNKTLSDIMDTEVRARVESDFVDQCSKYTLTDLLLNKETIMKSVRDDVTSYFKDRGITITVLGMKDGIEYDSKTIQSAIDDKFSSEQKIVTQKNENDRIISEAKAKAEANNIINNSINQNLIEYERMKDFYDKWDGKTFPQVMGGNGSTLFSVDGTDKTPEKSTTK